jgi:pimeloyl-ACP methyl ester carboxylesterase
VKVSSPPASGLSIGLRETLRAVDRFASFDGTKIAYQVAGEGRDTLLLHGFAAEHHSNWIAPGIVGALLMRDRRVILADARGHGQSEKPHDVAAYDNNAVVKDAAALLDHLDVEHVDVIGYSMGAMTAARLVPDEPRARSVVLGGVGDKLLIRRSARARNAIADALLAENARSIEHPAPRAFRRFAERTGADREALAAFQRAADAISPPEVERITIPTLVIAGSGDTLAGSVEGLAAQIHGAQSRVVPGEHLTAMFQAEFTDEVVTFLASVA